MQEKEEIASLTKARPESDRSGNPQGAGTVDPLARISGFHCDADGHWVVSLSCGHTQHLRHQPPWQNRAWVQDPARRHDLLGQPFECGWCVQVSSQKQGSQQKKDS